MSADSEYTEILRLDKLLSAANIPHDTVRLFDGWVVVYPVFDDRHRVCSAIEHGWSYGHQLDLIEQMGLIEGGGVKGYLHAEDVFAVIEKHWKNSSPKWKKLWYNII